MDTQRVWTRGNMHELRLLLSTFQDLRNIEWRWDIKNVWTTGNMHKRYIHFIRLKNIQSRLIPYAFGHTQTCTSALSVYSISKRLDSLCTVNGDMTTRQNHSGDRFCSRAGGQQPGIRLRLLRRIRALQAGRVDDFRAIQNGSLGAGVEGRGGIVIAFDFLVWGQRP